MPSVSGAVPIPEGMLPPIQFVIGGIWALGTALLCLRWALQWQSIRSALAFAPQMSMDLSVPVRISSDSLTTGVFGVSRPVVILPRAVMRELRPQELRAVLAHEACHIRRRDNLTAALHKCVEVVFWFHPLVWWIGANLLREREAACDESVIEEGHEQALYAVSILQVCRLGISAQSSHVAASTGGNLAQRMSSIMSSQRARPIDHGRFTLLFVTTMVACYVPLAAGIVTGAIREASDARPIAFDAITLRPSEAGWWHSTRFDADAGQLALKNVSFRDLISSAYPLSRVNGDPQLIDRAHYDIEASWHDQGGTSQRNAYRELLKRVLRTNTNLQVYIKEPCDAQCSDLTLAISPDTR